MVPTVTRADLVDRVAEAAQLTKKETEVVVTTIFDAMAAALARGDKIELRGFGSFRVRQRGARRARNPKAGGPVDVPAKRVPVFRPSTLVKEWLAAEAESVPRPVPRRAALGTTKAEPE